MGTVPPATRREALDPVADLRRRLTRELSAPAAAGARPRRTTERARVSSSLRACVHAWWTEHGLDTHPASIGKRIALVLIEQPAPEDKRAGILVLSELVGEQLRAHDLPAFARLFTGGHLADTGIADQFASDVLVTLLEREPGRAEAARVVAQWRDADSIFQRRACCLAFIGLASRGEATLPGLTGMILRVCATVVWSHEPLDQTAVGAVLGALGCAAPDAVTTFFRRHARLMSRACAREAVARLPGPLQTELLAHHKRATTPRQR